MGDSDDGTDLMTRVMRSSAPPRSDAPEDAADEASADAPEGTAEDTPEDGVQDVAPAESGPPADESDGASRSFAAPSDEVVVPPNAAVPSDAKPISVPPEDVEEQENSTEFSLLKLQAARGVASQAPAAPNTGRTVPPPVPTDGPLPPAAEEAMAQHKWRSERPRAIARDDSERVALEVEDQSLRLDNPYAMNSLMPPPEKPFPTGQVVRGVVLVAGLLGLLVLAFSVGGFLGDAEPGASAALSSAGPTSPSTPGSAQPQPTPEPEPSPEPAVEPTAAAAPTPTPTPTPDEPSGSTDPQPVGAAEANPGAKPEARSATARPAGGGDRGTAAGEPMPAPQPRGTEAAAQAALAEVLAGRGKQDEPAAPAPEPSAGAQPAPTPAPTPEPAVATAPPETLPEEPGRADIVAGFTEVHAKIRECAAGRRGNVAFNVTIANSGRVKSTVVEGDFKGSPEGSCMARAVRKARFPKFSKPTLRVSYPFVL